MVSRGYQTRKFMMIGIRQKKLLFNIEQAGELLIAEHRFTYSAIISSAACSNLLTQLFSKLISIVKNST